MIQFLSASGRINHDGTKAGSTGVFALINYLGFDGPELRAKLDFRHRVARIELTILEVVAFSSSAVDQFLCLRRYRNRWDSADEK